MFDKRCSNIACPTLFIACKEWNFGSLHLSGENCFT